MSSGFRTYQILEGLRIGAYPVDAEDVNTLSRLGIERVLNLVEDDEYAPGERDAVQEALAASGIEEWRLALVDEDGLPYELLEAAVLKVTRWLADGAQVYMHCRAGQHRSPALAAGVLALRGRMGIDEALSHVNARKPTADPLPQQREDLHRWWRTHSP